MSAHKLKIEFATDNAAFADGSGSFECAAILRKIADLLEHGNGGNGPDSGTIRDSNGNRCGEWSVVFPETEGGDA